jgi:putative O-methyltransferase
VSGTSIPYHLRQNKYVERRLFVDLLNQLDRWQALKRYLYVGFGAIYFEDFKLLHSHFAIERMLSIEKEEWVLPRQKLNVPLGCIDHDHCPSSEFIEKLDSYRAKYKVQNLLVWFDYAGLDLAGQLTDVKALVPGLLGRDILKVTLSADAEELAPAFGPVDQDVLEARYEKLREILGTQFLPDSVTPERMTKEGYPSILCEAFKRVVAQAMTESPTKTFQPIGCYVYKDTSQMITLTGIILERDEIEEFRQRTAIESFELAGLAWELQRIDVPDLSLREKFLLDGKIFHKASDVKFRKTAEEVAREIHFTFARDQDESLRMIRSYIKFYRYYPNYYPVVV